MISFSCIVSIRSFVAASKIVVSDTDCCIAVPGTNTAARFAASSVAAAGIGSGLETRAARCSETAAHTNFGTGTVGCFQTNCIPCSWYGRATEVLRCVVCLVH